MACVAFTLPVPLVPSTHLISAVQQPSQRCLAPAPAPIIQYPCMSATTTTHADSRGQTTSSSVSGPTGPAPLLDDDSGLPLYYDSSAIDRYWALRPGVTTARMWEVALRSFPWLFSVFVDTRLRRFYPRRRAAQLRALLTDLGPTFIKLGQALSVRPDLIGPAAMEELQLLCDAVPCFENDIAFATIENELGRPVQEIFEYVSETPVAGASLGQVYRARLKENGEDVAVKVQRPDMLRKVSLDLHILKKVAKVFQFVRRRLSSTRTDYQALLAEWAAATYKELDYVNEAENSRKFARLIAEGVPEVYVPGVYDKYTSRKVLTMQWVNGTKLSESSADDINRLVGVGVECFLYQLLSAGLFHSDPHPGNLFRTQDGRLCIIDFGLMAEVEKSQTDAMVAAIIHLANRDYKRVVDDFVLLDFLPDTVDKSQVRPVLAAILDQALQGGGAKAINFQSLSSELSAVTFDFPFKIPPYFALIIRALGVLEGIALCGDPHFKLIMESFPFVSRLIMTDDSPALREALRQILYKDGAFSATRLRVLLDSSQGVLGEGKAFVDFDTPNKNSRAASAALDFLFSEHGAVLRDIIADELANGIDVWFREAYARATSLVEMAVPSPLRAMMATAQRASLLAPPQLLLAPRTDNFALPPPSESDQRYLRNVGDLISLLVDRSQGGIGIEGLMRMLPQIGPKSLVLGRLVGAKLGQKYAERFFRDFVRANGEFVSGKRRF